MPKRPILLITSLVFGLWAAASSADTGARLGPNPTLGGGMYSTGGGLTVAMETRQINGKLGLCGVWAQSDRLSVYARTAARRVLSKGSVALNGKVITHNFNFLHRVSAAPSYEGAPAGCVVLNRQWRAEDATGALEIRIPHQRLHLSANYKRGASPRVYFTRADTSNPALSQGSLLPSRITSYSQGSWSN
jgi:hypothetical protein